MVIEKIEDGKEGKQNHTKRYKKIRIAKNSEDKRFSETSNRNRHSPISNQTQCVVKPSSIRPVYTWRTLTGVKLKTTEPSILAQQFFGSVTNTLNRNYTKRKVFRLCLFYESENFTLSVVPAQCLGYAAEKLLI